ncbi:GNAT family N-acetyltransferase [Cohnella terricola]|uniref:GNAT family N-acetyltransferase n=1 Tax=Cohnella terricola TaxID=1289167 RepID=A0A559JNB9_9BACL|nr:GNAT family N-acetyltransferase [Cohnella terricola]TVY01367.1 GNAT family N-acetyltransferase [Cohnella terricola]
MSQPLSKLIMRKQSLDDLPAFHCPTGFRLRPFLPGDERNWEELIRHSFIREVKFSHKIGDCVPFYADRLLFICKGNIPVATATAWETAEREIDSWFLHMVGVHPDYSGRGLGFAASLAALHKMKECGGRTAFLETDDFRLPAIRIYLKLGFEPVYRDESHPERWAKLLALTDYPL